MSNKLFSKATFAAIAFSVVASSATLGTSTAAQASVAALNISNAVAVQGEAEVQKVGYRHHRRHYKHGYGWHCHWKKKKVWSPYYGYYIWKKYKYCH